MKVKVEFDLEFDGKFFDKILAKNSGQYDGWSNLEIALKAAHGNLAEVVGTEIIISRSRYT